MSSKHEIPNDEAFDSTLALISEGYNFVSSRCSRYHSDIFSARIMLKHAYFLRGAEAAREFYTPGRFTRQHAMPVTTLKLLQDRGSVQLQEGDDHRQRKRMFMEMMNAANVGRLRLLFAEEWRHGFKGGSSKHAFVLHEQAREILCRSACRWVGITLSSKEAQERTMELGAMIDNAGKIGPRNWRALMLRARSERWARQIINAVREHRLRPDEESIISFLAAYQEHGALLPAEVAAVELLNILRPIVAVSRFIVFSALALHEHPEYRDRLSNDVRFQHWFVQEVRRFYPFFPLIGGRVREAFEWRGHHFETGTWMLLDLYGTNHDQNQWSDPDTFNPDRFGGWNESAFNFVPQGGGDYYLGHRCPGEPLTIALMETAVNLLVKRMRYEVPPQDLTIDMNRMPALPASGFLMSNVHMLQ